MAVIEVKNLKKYFTTPRGVLHAVDDVTLSIEKGKTLGVVGESGCGKSTLGRVLLQLYEQTAQGAGEDADYFPGSVFIPGSPQNG